MVAKISKGRRRSIGRSKGSVAEVTSKGDVSLLERFARFCRILFFAVVALSPLPFGSIDPTVIAFWCLVLGLASPLALAVDFSRGIAVILVGLLIFVLVYGGVLATQLGFIPWWVPPDITWHEAALLLNRPVPASPAMSYNSPLYSLGPSLACLLSLMIGLCVGCDRRHARLLLLVIAGSGAVYALYGIVSAIFDPTAILWREREAYEGDVIGTFTYRNTAATYFGCSMVVWLLLLCELIKKTMPRERLAWKHFKQEILSTARLDAGLYFACFLICLLALLMTGSRAGVVISLAAVAISVGVFFREDIRRKTSGHRIVLLTGIGLVVIVLLQVINGFLSRRLMASGISDEGRFDTYRAVLRIIADHPLLGIGLGGFPDVYPIYRDIPPDMRGRWLMAHSTPLEMAAELGIPLAAVVCLAWMGAFVLMIRGMFRRRRDAVIPLIGATTAGIAMVHSCIDFPMQITGFAIVVMALLGVGLSQAFGTTRDVVSDS